MRISTTFAQLSDYLPFIDEVEPEFESSGSFVQKLDSSKRQEVRQVNSSDVIEQKLIENSPMRSAHHSLQRKPSPKLTEATPTSARNQDDFSVVWLGRYSSSHVAIPMYGLNSPNSSCPMTNYSYELSDDFRQKQIEILERKYGGGLRCQRAASTIQRAFREYMVAKKWQQMRDPVMRRKFQRYHTVVSLQSSIGNGPMTHRVRPLPPAVSVLTANHKLHSQASDSALLKHHQGLNLHRYNTRPKLVKVSKIPGTKSQAPTVIYAQPPNVTVRATGRRRSVSAERQSCRIYPKMSVPHILSEKSEVLDYQPPTPFRLDEGESFFNNYGLLKLGDHSNYSRSSDISLTSHQSHASASASSLASECPSYMPCRPTELGSRSPYKSRATSIPNSLVYATNSNQSSPIDSISSHASSNTASTNSTSNSSPIWVPRPPVNDHAAAQTNLCRSLPVNKNVVVSRRVVSRPNDEKKRQYRIALNFFNKKPDRGMQLLMQYGFVEAVPAAVANFLTSRRGLSKQMIGEYLGNTQNQFHGAVLECFVYELDLSNREIDIALRKFLMLFRLPGEAQKIERIMEAFANRYCMCNEERMKQFVQSDTVFILAFAIVMLNTDLHSPNIKNDRRMKLEDFIKNLKKIDGGHDLDTQFLMGIYQRVKEQEFKPGQDHTTQVVKVDRSIMGKKPALSLSHRRLVCYCRLHEVLDSNKKQAANAHQREIFLFNDLIVITKVLNRKKNAVTYSYRQSHSLVGMQVQQFKTQHYPHGLRITHTLENKVLLFNARSEEDKLKFVEDLRESVMESDQMEALRIESEIEKQSLLRATTLSRADSQRDSGLPDLGDDATLRPSHRALSNSMLELVDSSSLHGQPIGVVQRPEQPINERRASINSLDSGMSSTASIESRESSPKSSTSGEPALVRGSKTKKSKAPNSTQTKSSPYPGKKNAFRLGRTSQI